MPLTLKAILRQSLFLILAALLPAFYLFCLHWISGNPLTLTSIAFWLGFSGLTLLFAALLKMPHQEGSVITFRPAWIILWFVFLAGTGLALMDPFWGSQALVTISLAALIALSMDLHAQLGGKPFSFRWVLVGGLVGAHTVLLITLINQILTRFSEEEFFALLQVILFLGYWGILTAVHTLNKTATKFLNKPLWMIPSSTLWIVWLICFSMVALWSLKSYQNSFYTLQTEPVSGATNEVPFICGSAPQQNSTVKSDQVFDTYIQQMAAITNQNAATTGFLFLATAENKWALSFHDRLLEEATQERFTQAANSIKYDQFLAAQRVYLYSQALLRKPNLFSSEEKQFVTNWFQKINRRAMTVEWVDWLYALAFRSFPKGPYLNQENGAGLLSLLEKSGLSDPSLASQNASFLAQNTGGWNLRFRNSDDSLLYQSEWITNAYFQGVPKDNISINNLKNSFEWVLVQMLPDGRAPQYNYPQPYELSGLLYFGAVLLNDPRFVWLANASLQTNAPSFPIIRGQMGAQNRISLTGTAPTQGSCLVYGDTSLPTQTGPLAPDKIIFRDGWSQGDGYLLLNLRFTGWHRYKGTNTITLIDRGEPIVGEQIEDKSFSWLPAGRALFRDKRIPRQNLNGFQIERQGLDKVLFQILGIGSPWAQDPPWLTQVNYFSTSPELDKSQTLLPNWHSWDHTRTIFFDHNGIIVVVDDATSPSKNSGAITWTIQNAQTVRENRYLIGQQSQNEMVLMGQSDGNFNIQPVSDGASQIMYTSSANGHLRLVTVFLSGVWLGGTIQIDESMALTVQQGVHISTIDLNSPGK